jgi:hypothetical protein
MKEKSIYIFGYLLKLITKIWQFRLFFTSTSGKFGPFFKLKILCKGQNFIFKEKFHQISPKKTHYKESL